MIVKNTDEALKECLAALGRRGSVLLVPTETVYGLVCDWCDAEARARIYQLKHRSENKPFAAFLPSVDAVFSCVPEPAGNGACFCGKILSWPRYAGGSGRRGSTFGFRIPDHPFILKLLKTYGKPLASTSANLSGVPAALSVADALKTIDGTPEVVVDAGVLPSDSKASTVILVNADSTWKILRPGPVTEEALKKALA